MPTTSELACSTATKTLARPSRMVIVCVMSGPKRFSVQRKMAVVSATRCRGEPLELVARNQLIARHTRRYGRHEDIEDPDHAKGLIAQRSRAREQRLMMHFLALSPDAPAYYDGLEQRRLNARHHVRKILALAEIYPADAVARAISDGLAFQAFSAEYITNILETRARALPEPGPLQLTRRHDLLDIDIAPPDLNAYEVNHHDSDSPDAIGRAAASLAPALHPKPLPSLGHQSRRAAALAPGLSGAAG